MYSTFLYHQSLADTHLLTSPKARNHSRRAARRGGATQVLHAVPTKRKNKMRPTVDAGEIKVELSLENIEIGETEVSSAPTTLGAIPTLVVGKRTKDAGGVLTDYVQVTLECFEGQKNDPGWKAKVLVEISMLSNKTTVAARTDKFQHVYHESSKKQVLPNFAPFSLLREAGSPYLKSKKFTIMARVKVLRASFNSFPYHDFSTGGDIVLQVGKAEYHVTKQYLATLSPFFNTLFFGEFSESQKAKIEIKDVEPQHFAEYLRVVYPSHKKVKASTVRSLLALSQRFETASVRALCEEYLCSKESCKEFGFKDKLLLADEHSLRQLKVTVMKRLCTKSAINKVMENPSGLQSETLEMICRKSTMLNEMEAAGASAMDVDSDRDRE